MDWPGDGPGLPRVIYGQFIYKLTYYLKKKVTLFLNAPDRLLFEMAV